MVRAYPSTLFNVLKLVLYLRTWSLLVNVLFTLVKNVHSAIIGDYSINAKCQSNGAIQVFYIIVFSCLLVVSINEKEDLKSPTVFEHLYFFFFNVISFYILKVLIQAYTLKVVTFLFQQFGFMCLCVILFIVLLLGFFVELECTHAS